MQELRFLNDTDCVKAYGAVHLAAWHAEFPSILERYMWRISAIDIACSGALWLTINLLAAASRRFDRFWDRIVRLDVHISVYYFLVVTCTCCGLAYAFARVYLVVEAFVSIRSLSPSAYDTPSWSQVFPHF